MLKCHQAHGTLLPQVPASWPTPQFLPPPGALARGGILLSAEGSPTSLLAPGNNATLLHLRGSDGGDTIPQ